MTSALTYVSEEAEEYLEDDPSVADLAIMLLGIINADRPRYEKIDRYVEGKHDDPYMPVGADAEYHMLAKRSVTNLMPLLMGTPAQMLYVDSFRSGGSGGEPIDVESAEWRHWQVSRLDARQLAIHRGALKYGHSFTLTEKVMKYGIEQVMTKGLSAYNTAAVYEDSANDIDPYAALTIVREPNAKAKTSRGRRGLAYLWDDTFKYEVTFQAIGNYESIRITEVAAHGLLECPVTRFAAAVDLEGRTTGVVEPNISIQDRINQTVFDLLVAQTYGSFKVRTVTGMAPPMKRWTQELIDGEVSIWGVTPPDGAEAGDPIIDPATGKPIPEPINLNARRFFFAEDENVKFGSIDGTSLDGYIRSLDMSIRHLAVATQTPPHYLLGEIANLAAEALQAAETSLLRKVEEFRKSFGESWERVFRIAGELSGNPEQATDYAGEVLWRDTEMRSLAATADALNKMKDLGIPLEGLWNRVPETTRTEIGNWFKLRDKDIAFRKQLSQVSPQVVGAEAQAEAYATQQQGQSSGGSGSNEN